MIAKVAAIEVRSYLKILKLFTRPPGLGVKPNASLIPYYIYDWPLIRATPDLCGRCSPGLVSGRCLDRELPRKPMAEGQ